MIRILHTADWHLGQTFFGYDRAEEHKAFLDWLAEEIRPVLLLVWLCLEIFPILQED